MIAVCSPDYSAPSKISLGEAIRYPLLLRECGSASRDLFDGVLAQKHFAVPLPRSSSQDEFFIVSNIESHISPRAVPRVSITFFILKRTETSSGKIGITIVQKIIAAAITTPIPARRCFVPFALINTNVIIIITSASSPPREPELKTIYTPSANNTAHTTV